MDAKHSMPSAGGGTSRSSLQEIVRDALRYWERRRVFYNLVLAVVVLLWLVSTWPHFRGAFTLQSLCFLFVFAMLANVCYCAAYVADVPMQYAMSRGLASLAVESLAARDDLRNCDRKLLDRGRNLPIRPLTDSPSRFNSTGPASRRALSPFQKP